MSEANVATDIYPLDEVVEESHAAGLADEVLAHLHDTKGVAPSEINVHICISYNADGADHSQS